MILSSFCRQDLGGERWSLVPLPLSPFLFAEADSLGIDLKQLKTRPYTRPEESIGNAGHVFGMGNWV